MRRRTPIQHTVRSHTRQRGGTQVSSYSRGSGTRTATSSGRYKPPKVSRSRTIREEGSARKTWEKYVVTFTYSDKRKEKLVIAARDSDDALNQALKIRKIKRKPVSIKVDDSIASVASAIASGVTQVVGGTVTGVARGVRTTITASQEAGLKRKAAEIERLIKLTQSKNPHERRLAKERLKKKHPEAYKRLAFKRV